MWEKKYRLSSSIYYAAFCMLICVPITIVAPLFAGLPWNNTYLVLPWMKAVIPSAFLVIFALYYTTYHSDTVMRFPR